MQFNIPVVCITYRTHGVYSLGKSHVTARSLQYKRVYVSQKNEKGRASLLLLLPLLAATAKVNLELHTEYDPKSLKQLCDKLDFVNMSNEDIFLYIFLFFFYRFAKRYHTTQEIVGCFCSRDYEFLMNR